MSIIEIVTYPEPVLLAPAVEVTNIDDSLVNLVKDMRETMYAAPGLGLAAPQVGVNQRFFVYDVGGDKDNPDFKVLVNPRIVHSEGKIVSENEGCLSVPEYRADVPRAAAVTVEGADLDGKPVRLDCEGLAAVVMQHEIDHLEGVLFIEHLSSLKREMIKRKLKKQAKSP
ncbi:MAG: peptide deformylase [Desulfatibacillaceae bacterium]